jgi:hypothetical protein
MSLKEKIQDAIEDFLPNGATCSVLLTKSGVGDTVIARVVTSAWKSMPSWMRTLKVQRELDKKLSPSERQKILRLTVFTPEELRKVLRVGTSGTVTLKGVAASPATRRIAAALRKKRSQRVRNNRADAQKRNELLLRALEKLRRAQVS